MKTKILFYSLYALFYVFSNLTIPLTPMLFSRWHLNSYIYGFSFSLMAFFNFLSSLFWSKHIQKYGPIRIIIISILGFSVAQWLFFNTSGTWMLLLSRSLAGIFTSGFVVATLSYILMLPGQMTYLSLSSFIQTISISLGYFLGGWLAKKGISLPFYIQIGGCLSLVCYCWVTFDRPKIVNKKICLKNPFHLLKQQLSKSHLHTKLFLSSLFFSSVGLFLVDNWLQYDLSQYYQFDTLQLGYYKIAIAFVSMCSLVLLTFYFYRFKSSLLWTLLGCILSLFLLFYTHQLHLFLVMMLVYQFFTTALYPLQLSCMKQRDDLHQSEQSGLFNSIRSLAMMVAPMLSGYFYPIHHRLAIVGASLSLGIAFVILCFYFYHLSHKK